jgi:hypothetical protein
MTNEFTGIIDLLEERKEEMVFPFFGVAAYESVNPRRVIQVVRGRRSRGA